MSRNGEGHGGQRHNTERGTAQERSLHRTLEDRYPQQRADRMTDKPKRQNRRKGTAPVLGHDRRPDLLQHGHQESEQ